MVTLRDRSQRLSVMYKQAVTVVVTREENSPYQSVMHNKFGAPGSFCAPQQEGFLVVEITFGTYA